MCRKQFALEPRENALHLHDVRVLRLAAALADPLQPGAAPLRYTADHLRMAASCKRLTPRYSGWLIGGGIVAFFGVVLLVIAGAIGAYVIIGPLIAMVAAVFMICYRRHKATARPRWLLGKPQSAAAFAGALKCWEKAYGQPPPGLLTVPARVTDIWPPTPPVALLHCADASTSAFLAASGIVERCGVALICQGREWPPESLRTADPALPVLVLHHADLAGCLEPPRLRAALAPGTRVIDAGLRPRVAERAGPPVRLSPDPSLLDELTRTGAVDAHERDWLARGNTYPLAAVRPARLLMAVERTLTRLDSEEERAAGVGFMAWPERAG